MKIVEENEEDVAVKKALSLPESAKTAVRDLVVDPTTVQTGFKTISWI